MPHIPVERCRIRPISLDRDNREAVLLYQMPRDCRPRAVELGRAMARLAQENDASIGKAVE
jgi:hypothetical protein